MENIELSNALYGSSRWSDIKELFTSDLKKCKTHDDINKLYNKYIPYIWFGRALNTVIKKYTDFRTLIGDSGSKHAKYALETVFLVGETVVNKEPFNIGIYGVTTAKANKRQLNKKRSDLRKIDVKKDFEKLVHTLKYKIDNDIFKTTSSQTVEMVRAYHLIMLLALVTGRRQVELLKTLEIDYNKNRKQKIYFKGIVKKGSKNLEKEAGTILFLTVQETKKYLKMLRQSLPAESLDNTRINQKYNGVIANALGSYVEKVMGWNNTVKVVDGNEVTIAVDKDGNDYDIDNSQELKWKIWKKTNNNNETISKETAIHFLKKGKKITSIDWGKNDYIVVPKLKFHDLRSIYAEYAWKTLGEGYTNKATFFDMVLNHEVSPTTADNYFKFEDEKVG